MGSEWPKITIEEISTVKSGKRLPKGEALISSPTPYPYIRLVDIADGKVSSSSFQYLTVAAREKIKRYIVNSEDVCLAIVGHTIGMVFYIDKKWDDINLTENAARITNICDEFNPRFIYYYLTSPDGQQDILSRKVGSAQGKLPLYNIKSLALPKPSRAEQDKIASLLQSLDDKIELNRQINQTLEQMAQALFKSWFIDFDPVIDNALAAGKEVPKGLQVQLSQRAIFQNTKQTAFLPATIKQLFPIEFEYTEEGLLPKGWAYRPLYSLADYINGASYKKFEPNVKGHGLPIIKIVELKAGVTNKTGHSTVTMPGKYLLQDTDILFAWSGNPDTSIDTFVWSNGPAWLNQHIFKVVPNKSVNRSYLLSLLKYLKPTFADIARDKQTTGLGHVTVKNLKEMMVPMPTENLMEAAGKQLQPLWDKHFNLTKEIQSLTKLRDTLLPKLISGELKIPDAEAQIANMTQ